VPCFSLVNSGFFWQKGRRVNGVPCRVDAVQAPQVAIAPPGAVHPARPEQAQHAPLGHRPLRVVARDKEWACDRRI
jgi:hypothetical protein